jgi:Fe-S oxidoreductase
VVHLHCHHRAIVHEASARATLDGLGLDYELLDSGCCGMAGAFGFERAHFDVAQKCGERKLLPAVRAAGEETLLVTDGFSCREQIEQNTGRRPLHLAELLQLALRGSQAADRARGIPRRSPAGKSALIGIVAASAALGLVWLRAKRRR